MSLTTVEPTATEPDAPLSPVVCADAVSDIPAVWDNLWRHAPSVARDDALIDRERRSPRWRRVASELAAGFGSIAGLRTIELGSGRGDLSALLAQLGAEVTLLDTSERALEQAQARFERLGLRVACVCSDMLDYANGASGTFDVSLSSGVIEHFRGDDRTRVIRSHFDVLRPGGMTVISVPHRWCLPYRLWKFYLELRGWWPYGMEIPYSKAELLRRARQVGFEPTGAWCMGFWQSVGDHWGKSLLRRRVDWVETRSCLDGVMGLVLLMIARRVS